MHKHAPLQAGKFYHIYNRGNDGVNLFYKHENYNYFLKQYDYYLGASVDTFAYCLLPNHFHLLIRVKDMSEQADDQTANTTIVSIEDKVSEQFRRLFTSYAKAINKQEIRDGSLFQKVFKRKEVSNANYFNQLVYYIHANPQSHMICDDFKVYPYSSYGSVLSEKVSKLKRNELLQWFGDKNGYLYYHSINRITRDIQELMLD